jgi:hypothetical protein
MFKKEDFGSDLGKQMQHDWPYLFLDEEAKKEKLDHRGYAVDTQIKTNKNNQHQDTNQTTSSVNLDERVIDEPTEQIKTNEDFSEQTIETKSKVDGLGQILSSLTKSQRLDVEDHGENMAELEIPRIITSDDIGKTIDAKITPYTIVRHLKNNRVVGEEANACLITIALANSMHTILEGYSGSGKNYVMDKILQLFNGKYELQLTSGQAVWYHADDINKSSILYLPELQKAVADRGNKTSGVIELMKSLGEGKDATRVVTNKDRTGVDTYVIKAGKTIASTIAHENNFKYDRELQRRFLILETDNTPEHIEEIIKDKVSRKMIVDVSGTKEYVQRQLAERIEYTRGLENIRILNPFINYMQETFPVINKTQSYMDHYLELFEAWGKFFSPEREKIEIDDTTFVMLNIEDVYNVFQMYNPHFMRIMQSFNEDQEIPCFKPNWAECVRQGFQSAQDQLTILTDNGEINIGKNYPTLIEQWKRNQVYGSKVFIEDYKTGNNIEIADLESITHNNNLSNQKSNVVVPVSIKPITDPARMLTEYASKS